jgi:glycosyltransferase 2 family protein
LSKQKLLKLLRNLVSFAVAFFLIRFVVLRSGLDVRQVWDTVHPGYLVLAFMSFGMGFLLASYRWYILLHHIQVKLPLLVVIRLALIGQFFNLFVPGGVGGDLIKMVYLRKEAGNRFPEAVLSVLLDRVLGLTGLLLLALLAVATQPAGVMSNSAPEMRLIMGVVAFAGICGLMGAVVFLLWPYLGRFSGLVSVLMGRLPGKVRGVLERVGQALSLVRSAPGKVGFLLLLAMVNHLFATLAVVLVGQGVGGAEKVSYQAYLLATQLANLVAAVPLTPGGLGGRDLVMSFLLGMSGAGASATGAIPLVVTTLMVTWSCIGGLALLWERTSGPMDAEPGEEPS